MTQMVHVGCMCQPSYAFVDVSSCFSDIPAISMDQTQSFSALQFFFAFQQFRFQRVGYRHAFGIHRVRIFYVPSSQVVNSRNITVSSSFLTLQNTILEACRLSVDGETLIFSQYSPSQYHWFGLKALTSLADASSDRFVHITQVDQHSWAQSVLGTENTGRVTMKNY